MVQLAVYVVREPRQAAPCSLCSRSPELGESVASISYGRGGIGHACERCLGQGRQIVVDQLVQSYRIHAQFMSGRADELEAAAAEGIEIFEGAVSGEE